jgi:iron-only hydrogenase group A
MLFEIEVNGKPIKARRGDTLLMTLERNGIKVPTLCHVRDLFPSGACRMCVVEVEGRQSLIPACSHPVEEWMKVHTHSPRVIKARKTNTELLLSNHPDDCLYCERNGNCELQKLAENLNVRERRFYGRKNRYKTDPSSASLLRDPAKCILCGRCIRICGEVQKISALDFIGRGNKTQVGPAFNKGMNLSNCINCGQCVMVCPTGALAEKQSQTKLQDALHNPAVKTVIQCSPSLSVTLAEEFGLRAGKDIEGVMFAALRKLGFDYVFDSSFGADLLVSEQATELLGRLKNPDAGPLFSSCCPAWVKYAEQTLPDMLGNLSLCKSPQQMLGAMITSHFSAQLGVPPDSVYSVSAMPCIARKFEAQREHMTHKGISDVDLVLTTRELARLIRLNGIDIEQVEPELSDRPYQARSSAGKMTAVTGGLTEAILRTLHFLITGKETAQLKIQEMRSGKGRKEYAVKIGEFKLGFAIVNGIGHVPALMDELRKGRRDLHYIEVMACEGGCVGGGGQPIHPGADHIRARAKSIYELDDKESNRFAHQNASLQALYRDFLIHPGSEVCRDHLYTTFESREVMQ